MTPSGRIVLGEDDFDDVPPATAEQPLPPAAAPGTLPPVARRPPLAVGSPTQNSTAKAGADAPSRWLHDARTAVLTAAVVGMAIGWGVTELFGIADMEATTNAEIHRTTGVWTGVIGLCFGGTLMSFDLAVQGAWEAAFKRFISSAIPMFIVGFISGFLASVLYVHFLEQILEGGDFSMDDARLYLVRSVAWGIFGAGVGAAIGLVDRSRQRAINGAIGGFAGGALGGLAFQFAGLHMGLSDNTARVIGLIVIGGLIAVATRAVESARKEAWLRVLGGGMTGKEFILYHPVTRIGASPDCEIFLLKDPAVAKSHAQIENQGSQRVLTATSDAPLYVNQAAATQHVLRNGDQLQIGNTVIGYAERAMAAAPTAPGTW